MCGNTHYKSPYLKEEEAERHLQVGEVVRSKSFVVAEYNCDRTHISIGINPKGPMLMRQRICEEERVRMAAETGKIPPKEMVVDLSADDETRATALFIVEQSQRDAASTDARGDSSPRSWRVIVRRLNDDGSYNRNGEVIHFCENKAFDCIREPGDLEVVGKMSLTFI